MPYQGHLPDGSSIQRHSAGSHYPYVVYGQETPDGVRYGVIGPKKTTIAQWSCAVACDVADRAAVMYRQAAKAAVAKVFVAASGEHVDIPLNTGRPDCGEAGHADGACGTTQCLPSYRPPVYPDAWGVS